MCLLHRSMALFKVYARVLNNYFQSFVSALPIKMSILDELVRMSLFRKAESSAKSSSLIILRVVS